MLKWLCPKKLPTRQEELAMNEFFFLQWMNERRTAQCNGRFPKLTMPIQSFNNFNLFLVDGKNLIVANQIKSKKKQLYLVYSFDGNPYPTVWYSLQILWEGGKKMKLEPFSICRQMFCQDDHFHSERKCPNLWVNLDTSYF